MTWQARSRPAQGWKDSWACVLVKTRIPLTICSQEFTLKKYKHAYLHLLCTGAKVRINLLPPLYVQIGFNTHSEDLVQTLKSAILLVSS